MENDDQRKDKQKISSEGNKVALVKKHLQIIENEPVIPPISLPIAPKKSGNKTEKLSDGNFATPSSPKQTALESESEKDTKMESTTKSVPGKNYVEALRQIEKKETEKRSEGKLVTPTSPRKIGLETEMDTKMENPTKSVQGALRQCEKKPTEKCSEGKLVTQTSPRKIGFESDSENDTDMESTPKSLQEENFVENLRQREKKQISLPIAPKKSGNKAEKLSDGNFATPTSPKQTESAKDNKEAGRDTKSRQGDNFVEALRQREEKQAEAVTVICSVIGNSSKSMNLEEENKFLKRRVLELELELRNANATIRKLAENSIQEFKGVKESLKKIAEEGNQNLQEAINSGELLPVGQVNTIDAKIHVGGGIWISKREYDFVRYRKSKSPEMFIKNIAVAIFTEEVLRKSSISGEASNRYKDRDKKPPLDPAKLNAVTEISEYWMRSLKMSECDISRHIANVSRYIGIKIACINRGPRLNQIKRKHSKSTESRRKKSKEYVSGDDESSEEVANSEAISNDVSKDQDSSEFEDEIFNVGKSGN